MFGVQAAVAMHLQSICQKSSDYVLELYLLANYLEKGRSLDENLGINVNRPDFAIEEDYLGKRWNSKEDYKHTENKVKKTSKNNTKDLKNKPKLRQKLKIQEP